jgi:CheY-like chemotaxis protein
MRRPGTGGERISPELSSQALEEQHAPLEGLRIAIVDDKKESLEMVARILRKSGAQVSVALDAKTTLTQLAVEVPDILIADLGMPEMDGYELLTCIRASESPLSELPAIALSALVTPADRSRAAEVGFLAFLAKPVDPKELVRTTLSLARPRKPVLAK